MNIESRCLFAFFFNLFVKSLLIMGEISDIFTGIPWMYGTIHLSDKSNVFHTYFKEMVDEESTFDFESIYTEFLNDENWSIFDENEGKLIFQLYILKMKQ